ncbi:hypothetical protein BOTBODRAFT_61516 [Botryobasidium botryosum FD-172 SS1]|uniref:Uncharacterized protein n=1 Tax=Botryobasidium botryosum (strain FD-172 SS1) TaxID=930990 RepID=A0A067N1S0_BOTB1|nr:hypothetical protein BOTBODRAFT_61516 [Botryobasidium botryosum FD-172 SS1]
MMLNISFIDQLGRGLRSESPIKKTTTPRRGYLSPAYDIAEGRAMPPYNSSSANNYNPSSLLLAGPLSPARPISQYIQPRSPQSRHQPALPLEHSSPPTPFNPQHISPFSGSAPAYQYPSSHAQRSYQPHSSSPPSSPSPSPSRPYIIKSNNQPHPPIRRVEMRDDKEETWSTLPPRKKQKPAHALDGRKSTGIAVSGKFRLPIAREDPSPVVPKRSVKMYKPPPMTKSTGKERAADPQVIMKISRVGKDTGRFGFCGGTPTKEGSGQGQRIINPAGKHGNCHCGHHIRHF